MEWYGYFFLILFLLTLISFILYIIFKPSNKSLSKIRLQLQRKEEDYRKLKSHFVKESVHRKDLEKEVVKLQLKELESKFSYDLATLSKREKEEYEKAKLNPKDGIDFIKSLIDGK